MSSESLDDVWCITEEQREYYIRQFTLMQDDLHGVISGSYRPLLVFLSVMMVTVARVLVTVVALVDLLCCCQCTDTLNDGYAVCRDYLQQFSKVSMEIFFCNTS